MNFSKLDRSTSSYHNSTNTGTIDIFFTVSRFRVNCFIVIVINLRAFQERAHEGLVKGAKLCLNPYFYWLVGEVSCLAVEVLSPCPNKSKDF